MTDAEKIEQGALEYAKEVMPEWPAQMLPSDLINCFKSAVEWRDQNPKPPAESDEKLREMRNKNFAQLLSLRMRDMKFLIGEQVSEFHVKGNRCIIDTKNVDLVLGERGPLLYPAGPLDRRTYYVGIEVNQPGGGHKRIPLHRLILARKLGQDDFEMCDHINSDRFDNREENLRPATATQNAQNCVRKPGKHKYKGVSFSKNNRWSAQIRAGGVVYHLGTYDSEIEVAIAYNEAAIQKHGEFAKLNDV